MQIIINGINATQTVLADSLVLDRYGANRSLFSFSMESVVGFSSTAPSVEVGMEVKLYGDDENLLWAGIVESCSSVQRDIRMRGVNVVCRGYEQVVSRLAIAPLYVKAANVGVAAQVLFERHLVGEGFSASSENFDMTGMITEYSSGKWKRLSRVYDELASLYGHRWWVDKQKRFFFRASTPVIETQNQLLLDATSPIPYREFILRKTQGIYRNCQVASDRGTVFGIAEKTAEITRMKNYFGSGKYYGIMESSQIESAEQAQLMAGSILAGVGGPKETVEFSSDQYFPELFEVLRIRGGQYGYAALTKFVVLRVRSVMSGGKLIHRVTAGKMDTDTFRPQRSWEEVLASNP